MFLTQRRSKTEAAFITENIDLSLIHISEGRSIKKDNDKAQRNLNDKNARKYVERLINENFTDRDLWLTFTYDNEHLPPDGDIDAAIKNCLLYTSEVRITDLFESEYK